MEIANISKKYHCDRLNELFTKKGDLKLRYCKVLSDLYKGYKIRMSWRNHGRNLDRSRYDIALDLLTILCVDYRTGNDAPRNGMNGYFVVLSGAGLLRFREIVDALNLKL